MSGESTPGNYLSVEEGLEGASGRAFGEVAREGSWNFGRALSLSPRPGQLPQLLSTPFRLSHRRL